jgi:hypothetical protein
LSDSKQLVEKIYLTLPQEKQRTGMIIGSDLYVNLAIREDQGRCKGYEMSVLDAM